MVTEDRKAELRRKIAALVDTLEKGEEEPAKLKKWREELAELEATPVELGEDDVFDTGMDEGELADVASGVSNRPAPGEYVAVLGKPDKNYSEKSIKIPVKIVEEGIPWTGYDNDAFYPSKSPDAQFSLKNICLSAGIKAQKNPKTGKMSWPIALLEGRKIMAVYEMKLTPGTWVGNDGVERENQPQSKLVKAKPFYEKPKTLM